MKSYYKSFNDLYKYTIECEKEIERLNNIIKEVKQQLLNKKDIVEKSKYFRLVYTDEEMQHIWDKTIINKMDELLEILGDDENE